MFSLNGFVGDFILLFLFNSYCMWRARARARARVCVCVCVCELFDWVLGGRGFLKTKFILLFCCFVLFCLGCCSFYNFYVCGLFLSGLFCVVLLFWGFFVWGGGGEGFRFLGFGLILLLLFVCLFYFLGWVGVWVLFCFMVSG